MDLLWVVGVAGAFSTYDALFRNRPARADAPRANHQGGLFMLHFGQQTFQVGGGLAQIPSRWWIGQTCGIWTDVHHFLEEPDLKILSDRERTPDVGREEVSAVCSMGLGTCLYYRCTCFSTV